MQVQGVLRLNRLWCIMLKHTGVCTYTETYGVYTRVWYVYEKRMYIRGYIIVYIHELMVCINKWVQVRRLSVDAQLWGLKLCP